MNRMYHIKKYILDHSIYDATGKQQVSVDRIIELFLEYLDDNKIVYGEGEFHRIAADNRTVIDEKV